MSESLLLLDTSMWSGGLLDGDAALLACCADPTLDVGCGPGRLAAALHCAGITALGVDVSRHAVREARRRGARVIRADVFGPVPAEGSWRTVLLADGNIGIGGDPVRLLRRCARLLADGGHVVAELSPPGEPSWRGPAVLREDSRDSEPLPWATVPADQVAVVGGQAALCVRREWTEARRWFVELERP
ncbi:MAG TPA: class I SAM-dependent methyltransferase [Micromonosporaceae bacterium]|nr:class I SAM-dependent methyltransferase [Micromonosporaceae bacterium]